MPTEQLCPPAPGPGGNHAPEASTVRRILVICAPVSPLAVPIPAGRRAIPRGRPVEWPGIIVILVPIFLSLLRHFGIDSPFLDILAGLHRQTPFLPRRSAMSASSPTGISLPRVQLTATVRGCIPYRMTVFISMFMPCALPQIDYRLPELARGK